MKPTDKNSPTNKKNKASDNTLLYILLLILVAILIGSLTWYYWNKKDEQQQEYDYKKELGDKKISPKADDVSKLIQSIRNWRKTAERMLAGKIRGRKLTDKEKSEVEKELEHLKSKEDFTDFLQGQKIEDIEKQNPATLANIYSELYELGKVTVRLKNKTSVRRSLAELKKQQEIQSRWENNISNHEIEEMTAEMNKWITKWYKQARAELIGSEPGKYPLLTEYVVPWYENGKKIESPSQEQINKQKRVHELRNKKGEEIKIDLSKPLVIEFENYYGFLTEEDKKNSGESLETFGLTKPTGVSTFGGSQIRSVETDHNCEPIGPIPPDYHSVKIIGNNYRRMSIGLEKRLFFNRLGHEEWLNEVGEKGGRNYFDISFEDCVETMAHELAHAIVNTTKADYKGEEGGGHGEFFYEVMAKIEKMIKDSPDFKDFKTWWEKPEKEQKELSVESVLMAKPSHWDEWKYWYIGGGAIVIILVVGLVIVLWDGAADDKKNAKN